MLQNDKFNKDKNLNAEVERSLETEVERSPVDLSMAL
jgi:hypothetical protein